MTTVYLSPLGGAGWQFFDDNGVPLSGGLLYTYAAGTTTPQVTYTSSAGGTACPNPIVLDSAGRPPAEIWLTSGLSYKFTLKDSTFKAHSSLISPPLHYPLYYPLHCPWLATLSG